MVRVKRGNVAKNRRKRVLNFAKGFKGAHSRLFRVANGQGMKAFVYSYVRRKRRKQDFKKLWICRVNAAARNRRECAPLNPFAKFKTRLRRFLATLPRFTLTIFLVLKFGYLRCVQKRKQEKLLEVDVN
jgi:ribosomal protein L20